MRYKDYLRNFFRRTGHNVQGVDTTAHQGCDGCIDQPVALKLRTTLERGGNESDAKVAALTGTRVTGVPCMRHSAVSERTLSDID